MKIFLLSDIHLTTRKFACRTDDIVDYQFEKLEYVFGEAISNNAPVLIAADVFDKPRSWWLLSRMTRFFKAYRGSIDVYAVYGQHDIYLYSRHSRDATNLGLLAEAGMVKILSGELPEQIGEVHVYGVSYGDDIPQPVPDAHNILVAHIPVSVRGAVNENVDFSLASRFLRQNEDYDLILVGDIHHKFHYKRGYRHILNTGPMIRKTVDLIDHHPCYAVYDTEKSDIRWYEIPHDPGGSVITRDHIELEEEIEQNFEEFLKTASTIHESGEGIKFRKVLSQLITENLKSGAINNRVVDIIGDLKKGES